MQNPMHFYLVTALIGYEKGDAGLKQRHFNLVLQSKKKLITNATLNDARVALIQRFHQETGHVMEDIRSFTFMGFSYLGLMTEAEFQGEKKASPLNS